MTILNKKLMGERISYAMQKAEITPAILSDKMGVSRTIISQWKKGSKVPGINHLLEISDLTEMPIDFFLPVIRGIPQK